MKYKILTLFVVLILLVSCSTIKTVKLMNKGEVAQKEFKTEIPFEWRMGVIILKVTIDGNEYDFLLDSGAPNVISTKLSKKISTKSKINKEVGDSQGNKDNLDFVEVNKITIGNIDFLNTGAAIADLEASQVIACLNIDGLIGANLMKKAIWKIDYQKQIITITNSIEKLNITEPYKRIRFFQELTKTPVVDLEIDEHKIRDVTLDLGSNGYIGLNKKSYNLLLKKGYQGSFVTSYGSSASGLYGESKKDSSHYTKVPSILMSDLEIENAIISFDKGSQTIGNRFFENYDLVFNWGKNELLMIERKEYNRKNLKTFGFAFTKNENKLVISEIYNNSMAQKMGLKIGDQILQIDDINYENVNSELWCKTLENNPLKNEKEITIIVQQGDDKKTFKLKKESLL